MKYINNKLTLTLSLSLGLIACSSQNTDKKTLTFATEATYPPFEMIAPSGKIEGFDIDVANAICNKLHVQCQFINQPFDSLIPNLKLGKFDAIIASLAITPERQKAVDFTAPYYVDTVSFITPKNVNLDISPQGLKNKTIGVQQGTTFENYLNKTYDKNVTVKTYASEQSAFTDLAAGRVDAVMGDTPLIALWMKQHGNNQYHFVGEPITDTAFFGVGNGIAVKQGNKALLDELNSAITVLIENGTIKQIANKYFVE